MLPTTLRQTSQPWTAKAWRPLLAAMLGVVLVQAVAGEATTSLVLERYRQLLAEEDVGSTADLRTLMSSQAANGTWADIDYKDPGVGRWKPIQHLHRVRLLTLALCRPGHELAGNQAGWAAVERGLQHWVSAKYQNKNWWFNEIGVPRAMRDIYIARG